MIQQPVHSSNHRNFSRFSALAVLAICFLASTANADLVTVTIEAPGVQESSLATNPGDFGATDVHVENFDGLLTGSNSNPAFSGNSSIGSYDFIFTQVADPYGGAGGVGKFAQTGLTNTTVLTLQNPQRYFGFWWSAGDANNKVEFYNNGALLTSYTTSNVLDFLDGKSNKDDYFGNPNGPFLGQNNTEPYAFLNFFMDCEDQNVVFDEVRLINISTPSFPSGFESDNHTIASGYTTIAGETITGCGAIPEPATAALLGLIGLGVCVRRRRASE